MMLMRNSADLVIQRHSARPALLAGLVITFLGLPPLVRGQSQPSSLKLLISIEQATITAPFPARVTLNLHNGGNQTVWLYRKVRSPHEAAPRATEENQAPETSGGSTLVVKLDPAGSAGAGSDVTPGRGTVLESVGMPKPKLVRLGAGEDYEEKATLHLEPVRSGTDPSAQAGGEGKPVWGRYRLSVIYRARFSNAEEVQRNLGTTLWQGEAASNTVDIDFLAPTAQGSINGVVTRADATPITDARVTLSDRDERPVDQARTDADGRFSFAHLPPSMYWLTARREEATEDTVTFQHVDVTADQPAAKLQLVMLPQEIYEAQKVLHKPVLILVTDNAGRPLDKTRLEITYSNGPILDNVKAESGSDGLVAVELIPGRNFVTLKRRKCPDQQERADVAVGQGIDDFKFVFACAKE